jgi:hypothetical protein
VAKPGEKDLEYIHFVEAMDWAKLAVLWAEIQKEDTPGWEGGKALKHLIIRAFKLSGLETE